MNPIVEILSATNHVLADAGSYFVAKNPTMDTGIATIAAPTAYDGTKPWLLIKGPTTPGKKTRLDYLRLRCTAIGTAGAKLFAVIVVDPTTKADPTGGTALALNCTNAGAAPTFESKIFAGANVAAADSGSARTVTASFLKGAIPALNDVYLLKFGGVDQGVSTTASLVYYGGPPLVIPSGSIAQISLILPSQTAASSYELELGGWER